MSKLKDAIPTATLMIIVGAVFGWSFYRLIYTALTDVLGEMGITGDYWTNIIIIVGMGILLYVGGKKIDDIIK